MVKNNRVNCIICGKGFNKHYKSKTKIAHLVCSKECYHKARRKFNIEYSRESRKRLLKEHRCQICRKKIKPIRCPHCKKAIRYKSRCEECLGKINKKN